MKVWQGTLRIECGFKIPFRVVEILGSEFCNVYFHNIEVFMFYDVGFKLSIKSEKAALGWDVISLSTGIHWIICWT